MAYTLPQMHIFTPTISGTLGYSDDLEYDATNLVGAFSNFNSDYVYWNAGLSLAVEKLTFDFRYWDTNIGNTLGDFQYGLADSRFVFSVKATLP